MQAHEAPNGQLLSLIKPFRSDRYGTAAVFIDGVNHTDQFQQNSIGTVVNSAQNLAIGSDIRTDNSPSPGGRYSSVFPLWDGTERLLISWSPCRLLENEIIVACTAERLQAANAEEAPPIYGIWVADVNAGTQVPVVLPEESTIYTDIVAAHPTAVTLSPGRHNN